MNDIYSVTNLLLSHLNGDTYLPSSNPLMVNQKSDLKLAKTKEGLGANG